MWRKVLAGVCVPLAAMFTASTLYGTLLLFVEPKEGPKSYVITYLVVSLGVHAVVAVVLFFWWRWIIRTLRRPRGSTKE